MGSCRRSVIFILFTLFLCSSCGFLYNTQPRTCVDMPIQPEGTLNFIHPDGSAAASISIEIADTLADQEKGLMGRCSINMDTGMLFIFDWVEPKGFWMRNTLIPLDIIFVSEDKRIINMIEHTKPMSRKILRSEKPIKYAIEVCAGFIKRFGIAEGMCIEWKRISDEFVKSPI